MKSKPIFFLQLACIVITISSSASNSKASKYFIDEREYIERNSIQSGDNSINAIASGKSEILLVIAEDGERVLYDSTIFKVHTRE